MRETLTFVSWRWQSPVGYRSTFDPESVTSLRDMIRKHYPHPHRFVCVTDRPHDLRGTGVETIQMWEDCAAIPSPFGQHNPSCYRRLKVFARDAGKIFGPRLVSIDLDTVIVREITPLFDRDEDFVAWGESDFKQQWVNGSLWMLKTGSHPEVWETFDEETSPQISKSAGCFGSDQGWINYMLGGPNLPRWGRQDGVYSFRKHIRPAGNVLPANARIVCFHGKWDPWDYRIYQTPWITEHYPRTQIIRS